MRNIFDNSCNQFQQEHAVPITPKKFDENQFELTHQDETIQIIGAMDEFQNQITPEKRVDRMRINQMSSHAKKRSFC